MHSIFKWQKINFQTSQFNHFAFCCKSMTSSGHDVVKVFFFTCPTDPIWVWVQRIPSFFMYYCKQKFYNHSSKAWGFMLQNQGNMPWWPANLSTKCRFNVLIFFNDKGFISIDWYERRKIKFPWNTRIFILSWAIFIQDCFIINDSFVNAILQHYVLKKTKLFETLLLIWKVESCF